MIVDVVDLNFETLNFSKRYDSARYRRGTQIYRNSFAQIKKVERIDEENYFVKASVEGSYSTYTTTLNIQRNLIKNCTCTCEDYYNGFLCKHIIATSMETIEPHYASTEAGRKKLIQKRQEEEKKRLEEIRRRQEEEKKRRLYERKYHTGIKTIDLFKDASHEEKEANYDIKELYEKTLKLKNENTRASANAIKLECCIEFENLQTLKVNIKIGQTRMYVLNNIDEFLEAYENEKEIYYGKQLKFIPKRENFVEESQEMFDFIIKYAQMMRDNGKYGDYNSPYFSNKVMYVISEYIEEFLNINKDTGICVKTSYAGILKYEFTEQNLDVHSILSKEVVEIPSYNYWYYYDANDYDNESEEYILKLNIDNYFILIDSKKIYVFYNQKIYSLDKNRKTVKLFELFNKEDKIIIPEDRLDEFEKYVLSQIEYVKSDILLNENVKEGLIVNKLASKILLDIDDDKNIILELKFCYDNYEFNILEKIDDIPTNIVRNLPEEANVLKRLFIDGFDLIKDRKQFVMQDEASEYEFLSSKIQGYMNDYEVLVTDKFKNKQIKQPKISNIGIRVDNGLLELDISKINIDINEIKDVLKEYKIKKKYYKLKNGDFLTLVNNEDLKLLDEIDTTLDVDYSKIEEGIVNLPINRSMYLENLMNNHNKIKINKNEEYKKIIDNIENLQDVQIDKEFDDRLRDYQKSGVKWLKTLEKYGMGGILADDMGLGKTLQIIALLKMQINSDNKTSSIVVCPSTLVLNWKAEIEKWCDSMNVLIINGTAEERITKIENYQDYDVIITSYDLLKRDIEYYENKKFKYIIADEAQYIKNSATQNATALKSLNGETKFALTGTPIENSIAELWSIFDFIMPGYLYSYNKFKKKFEEPILKLEDSETLVRLKRLISPFILRRVKKDVLTELPDKNITLIKNEMESEQERLYSVYLAQTQKEVAEELNNSSFEKSKFKILMLLTRLRQICCHPSLFIENYTGSSGKLKQCLDLIIDAIESEHKILLFSSYTSMFDIIEKELNKLGIKYFKLVGNTPVSKRIEMVEEFNNNSEIKIFLISLKAGGTGLNLTSADIVIHYDPWWNVSSENQATDRAYRIGQKNSVQVYKLITSNSIEEKINKMQERKEKLSKDILSTDETLISKMSKEEILDLFKE